MAAIDQPVGHALAVREAAAACRLSPRTIRRKLNAGVFPNAYKSPSADDPGHAASGRSRSRDLERRASNPHSCTRRSPSRPRAPNPIRSGPTVLELVRSDRFGRLRAELAEAVAAAELALLRAEAERWRVIADERAQALERGRPRAQGLEQRDAVGRHARRTAAGCPRRHGIGSPARSAEAMRYTATLQALHDMRKQERRWWHFWR